MENNLPVNIREYQELAKKALPKMHYDYINGGAEDEHTLRDNIAAYGRILYCSYTTSSWCLRTEIFQQHWMVAPANANLEGLMPIDDLDTADGSKLEKYARDTLDPSLSWKDVEWLKSITSLPILLKGIVTAEDARKAVEAGAAGIIVSNHGARQLDYAPATISALEEVVKAVAGAVPVLVDGGVRRGTDVLKALALGARAVMVGRPP
uniref:(S)-2-hydroxy-acid oxidase n=1 Tax=Aegilops tauschii TaxID=37682 RepID=M8CDY8_AEGTA